eukprot:3041110-Amphidinium_carterae.3
MSASGWASTFRSTSVQDTAGKGIGVAQQDLCCNSSIGCIVIVSCAVCLHNSTFAPTMNAIQTQYVA